MPQDHARKQSPAEGARRTPPARPGRRAGFLILLAGLALTALLFWRQGAPPSAMPEPVLAAAPAVSPPPPSPAPTVIPPAPPAPPLPFDPPVALEDLVYELSLQAMPPPLPPWRRNAAAWTRAPGQPAIAIVIDDLGPAPAATRKAIALPGPLTLAFLPYAENLPALTEQARARGHELIVHMPMEPLDLKHNRPGEGRC